MFLYTDSMLDFQHTNAYGFPFLRTRNRLLYERLRFPLAEPATECITNAYGFPFLRTRNRLLYKRLRSPLAEPATECITACRFLHLHW